MRDSCRPTKKRDVPAQSLCMQQGVRRADARPHLVLKRLYPHFGQLIP